MLFVLLVDSIDDWTLFEFKMMCAFDEGIIIMLRMFINDSSHPHIGLYVHTITYTYIDHRLYRA